jgi:DNA invertase Pin-like site-specific DNA recombinase
MTMIGYARVSTRDQDPALQHDALTAAGCLRVFTDTASGRLDSRPQLDACLDYLRPGDTLVVWKLDRLGRSLRHLVELTRLLGERGIELRSVQDALDTTTPAGKLLFHIMAALAEFEADLIRDRTAAGLAAARTRGRLGGRPTVLTPEKLAVARQMQRSGEHTMATIAKTLGVGRSTLYRALGCPDERPGPARTEASA